MPVVRARLTGGVSDRRGLFIGLLGLAAFSAFFLVRPFLDPGPAYRPRPPGTAQAYSFLIVAAFVPYGLAVWATRHGVRLGWAVAGAVVLHGLLLPAALTQSQDLYAYLFYGKLWTVHGANPYVELPSTFASDPWFPWVRWPGQPSVYGPLWTMATAVPAWVSQGSLAVGFALTKVMVGAFGVAAAGGLIRSAWDEGLDAGRTLVLVGWNPLVLVSVPLGGHADVAVAAAIVWAVVADRRGRPVAAALLLVAATLVKVYAGVVLAVYLLALARRSGRVALGATLASAGAAALAWAPLWAGPETLAGLARIGGRASSSLGGTVQTALGSVLPADLAGWVVRTVGLLVVATVILLVARSPGFAGDPWPGCAAAFAAYLAVTPWFLPWHLIGLLTLAAVAGSAGLRAAAFVFSGTALLTASFGGSWWGRWFQTLLRYGAPALAWIRAGARRGTAPPAARSRPPLRP